MQIIATSARGSQGQVPLTLMPGTAVRWTVRRALRVGPAPPSLGHLEGGLCGCVIRFRSFGRKCKKKTASKLFLLKLHSVHFIVVILSFHHRSSLDKWVNGTCPCDPLKWATVLAPTSALPWPYGFSTDFRAALMSAARSLPHSCSTRRLPVYPLSYTCWRK